jgi:hypothetical protein
VKVKEKVKVGYYNVSKLNSYIFFLDISVMSSLNFGAEPFVPQTQQIFELKTKLSEQNAFLISVMDGNARYHKLVQKLRKERNALHAINQNVCIIFDDIRRDNPSLEELTVVITALLNKMPGMEEIRD